MQLDKYIYMPLKFLTIFPVNPIHLELPPFFQPSAKVCWKCSGKTISASDPAPVTN